MKAMRAFKDQTGELFVEDLEKNVDMVEQEKPVEVEDKPEIPEVSEKEPTLNEAIKYIAGKISEEDASDALKRLAQAVLDGSWYQSTR